MPINGATRRIPRKSVKKDRVIFLVIAREKFHSRWNRGFELGRIVLRKRRVFSFNTDHLTRLDRRGKQDARFNLPLRPKTRIRNILFLKKETLNVKPCVCERWVYRETKIHILHSSNFLIKMILLLSAPREYFTSVCISANLSKVYRKDRIKNRYQHQIYTEYTQDRSEFSISTKN